MAFTILSGFRTRAKQTAIEVWKARFIWGDNDLVKANHASRVSLVAMGGLRGVAVRDDGHLSIFRALNRREVADHWVAMMRDWGEQRLNQWGARVCMGICPGSGSAQWKSGRVSLLPQRHIGRHCSDPSFGIERSIARWRCSSGRDALACRRGLC